jgi:hypothetical protein
MEQDSRTQQSAKNIVNWNNAKTKIQAICMKVLKTIEGRTRRDRIRNGIFGEVWIQILLVELKKNSDNNFAM